VDGLVLIFWCAIKLNFVTIVWGGIYPQSRHLQPTVHKVLVRSVKIKDALQLKSIVVLLDQALYACNIRKDANGVKTRETPFSLAQLERFQSNSISSL